MPATTRHHALIGRLVEEKGREPIYQAMMAVGYSESYARASTKLTQSKTFQDLLEQELPDDALVKVHKQLLVTKRVEHMVFPLGPAEDIRSDNPDPDDEEHTSLTDENIIELLAEVGGTVRRIVHGQTARHVYFWVANDKARHDALKLAYDIKGKIKPSSEGAINNYNTFVQQNNIDPNTPENKQLVKLMTDAMMSATKRKVIDL